jgi:hypothetical protein
MLLHFIYYKVYKPKMQFQINLIFNEKIFQHFSENNQ